MRFVIGISILLSLASTGCFQYARERSIKCAHECAQIFGVIPGEVIGCRAKCFFHDCEEHCILPKDHPRKDGEPIKRAQ